jgi:hypothetical protein
LSKRWKTIILVLIFVILTCLLNGFWLPFFGEFLVVGDNLEKSDVIIVLGSDPEGAREDWAAILYKKGLGKKIIMCGKPVQRKL